MRPLPSSIFVPGLSNKSPHEIAFSPYGINRVTRGGGGGCVCGGGGGGGVLGFLKMKVVGGGEWGMGL